MKKRFFALTFILMTATSIAVFAQRGQCPNGFQRPGKASGPNPEMSNYFTNNILPVLISEREALNNQLSQTDKARIDEIRAEMNSMRQSMQAHRAEMRESNERPSLEQRKAMREHRNKRHELMDEIAELSFKYDVEISSSLEALREQAESWRNEYRSIRKENNQRGYNRSGNMRGAGSKGPGSHGKGMGPKRWMTPEGFLLFDPANPMPFADDNGIMPGNAQINLFPNPADKSVQLSANIEQASDVTIELIDQDGQVVLTKSYRNANEGLFTETLNLEGLDNGIYFVKVKAGEQTKVKQLIIRK